MKIKHDKKKESYPHQPIPVSQLTVDYTWSQVSSVERGGAGVLMFLPPLTRKQFHGFSKMISPKKSFPTQSTKASPCTHEDPLHYLVLSLQEEPRKSVILLCINYLILHSANVWWTSIK